MTSLHPAAEFRMIMANPLHPAAEFRMIMAKPFHPVAEFRMIMANPFHPAAKFLITFGKCPKVNAFSPCLPRNLRVFPEG